MPLSEDDYKLAAALVTSLVGSFLGAFLGAQKEKRESYRKLLQKDIKEIGNTTYQSVAIAKTLLNRNKKIKIVPVGLQNIKRIEYVLNP